MRDRFGYRTPDDWYEARVAELVTPETRWLDIGCGRSPFPSNPGLARMLADRCARLVGIDPSENALDNSFVHERSQCALENFWTEQRFDLITARMVAEHIENPATAVGAMARLAAPGGLVVIYTVEKWSPATVVSAITPMRFHHAVKRILWCSEERDTFPAVYRMNTRRDLRRLFEGAGFREEGFHHLADCRSFARWRWGSRAELIAWRCLSAVGLRYPEACILALYRRDAA